jgi:hypothetical protein
MKTNTLIQLPKFNYTSLDFETIIADIKQIVEEHPEYNTNWNDFIETDAGRILIELVSFVMEKFSSRLDWVAREMFIGTATQRQSQINLLQLINYRPQLPTPAFVNVDALLTKWVPPFDFPAMFTLSATDTTGALTQFELLKMADDGKPDYNYIYHCNTGTEEDKVKEFKNLSFYQGNTHTDTDLYTDGVSNESFEIAGFPVLDKSIRVYSETSGKECIEVDSFISPEAQQPEVSAALKRIPYMVKIDAENRAKVIFGNDTIVNIPNKDEKFKIYYRTGGGISTNIVKGGISSTKTVSAGTADRVSIIFSNEEKGFGGSGGENISEARLTAPLSLRSANKTVTNEDYVIHLENINIVKRAKIVSKENEPEDLVKDLGYRLPPLDTWIYVIPDRSGLIELDPLELNKVLKISRNYKENGIIDYTDVQFSNEFQTVMVKGLRYYKYHTKCLISNNDGIETVYYENVDFTIDYLNEEITRIPTIDDGNIPAGTGNYKLLYLYNDTPEEFVDKCKRVLKNGRAVLSTNAAVELYPGFTIHVYNSNRSKEYVLGTDYKISYATNLLELPVGSTINEDTIIVNYADNYDTGAYSEEKVILDYLKNKKMLCVDNYVKQTIFNTYDIKAVVYCYKNLRGQVQNTLAERLHELLNVENAKYDRPISKSEIMSFIMNTEGVRFCDIEYLGRDYYAYRKYVRDGLPEEFLKEYSAEPVEHKITPKYNEIYIVAADEWEGPDQIYDNQRHGVILKFVEA